MRLGLMGGTFDPVHMAHLIIAEEARVQLRLDEIVFIPTGQPWLKDANPIAPPEARLQMVRLAVASNPFFTVSDMEVAREGPSYTVDTLQALHKDMDDSLEVYFIIGSDSLAGLPRWKAPEQILQLCNLVVFPRPDHPLSILEEVESVLPGLKAKASILNGPLIGISSTEIRQRVANGMSIKYLVPAEVEDYIVTNGLYH